MKEIPLTKGYVALVDDEDFERLSKFKYWGQVNCGYVDARRYAQGQNGSEVYVRMACDVLNVPRTTTVDHKNRNSLDNRKENLRVATRSQNSINWVRRNKYGRGVALVGGMFQVRIAVNGKRKLIGYYKTPEEARAAYDAAAKQLHGEFAVLNSRE